MKKFVNEAIEDVLKGKEELRPEWDNLHKANFDAFVNALENDQLELQEGSDFNVDYENLTVAIDSNWTDPGDTGDYECSTTVIFDFKNGQIKQSGECENDEIEVPGTGYMTSWSYSQNQEETFDPKQYNSIKDFNDLLEETVENYCSLFSQFAQKDGESEAQTDYCPDCGSPEDECDKCENCGQCMNVCDCDEDDDDEDYDDDDDDDDDEDEELDEEAMGGVSSPMSTLNNTPGMGNVVPPQQNTNGSGDKWGSDSSLGPYTQGGKVEEGWGKNIAAGAMLGAASLMPMQAKSHKSDVDNKPKIERQINRMQKEYEIALQDYAQSKKANPNYDADKKIYAELMQWKKRIENDSKTYKFGDKIQAESFYPSLDIVVNEESISPYDKIGSMMAKKMGVPLNFKKGKNTSASEVHQVNVEKPKNQKYKVKSKVKTNKI